MAKLTLDDLKKLREKTKNEFSNREMDGKTVEIIIGMGTCGIAAGAKETMDSFIKTLNARGLTNVLVKQTGCMGSCKYEPTVEVKTPGMPAIIYQTVTSELAVQIVDKHIIGKQLLDDYVQDRPSIDIIKK